MTTIVTSTATVAENIGDEGLNWLNPTFALVDDGLSASVVLDGTTDSKRLWVHDFEFALPEDPTLTVAGIKVTFFRTGSGETEDFQAVLTYDATPSFTVSKHKPGFWNDTDDTANYGGATDIWNRIWTPAEINNSQFGFAISVESPDNLDEALADFVEITIYWNRTFDEVAVGGASGGGSADLIHTVKGGALVGGHGVQTHVEIVTGGILVTGTAGGESGIGGALINGSATELTLYIAAKNGGAIAGGLADISLYDNFFVSGGASVSGTAVVPVVSIFPLGGIVIFASTPSIIKYTGNAIGDGGVILNVAAFIDPVIGDGGVVIQHRTESPAPKFTIYNPTPAGGAICSGLSLMRNIIPIGGGVLASGLADHGITFIKTTTGGTIIGGSAIVEPFFETGTGGGVVGGVALVIPYFEFGTGGAVAGGTARITFNYDTNRNPNELQMFARGKFFVPPFTTDEVAICSFTLDPVTLLLTWNLTHNMGSELKFVRVRGPALANEAGGDVIVSIDTLQDVTVSPIRGSQIISASQAADYQNGLHWILFRTLFSTVKLRAQIQELSNVHITPTALTFSTGGANNARLKVGGSADIILIANTTGTGGAGVNSPDIDGVPIFIFLPGASGGVLDNGFATHVYTGNELVTGGAVVGGQAINTVIFFNINGDGGSIIAGKGIIEITPKIGGGGIVSGLLFHLHVGNPVITGGGLVEGLAQQSFTDFFIATGHILVGGSSIGSKIKFFRFQKNGYGRAMASDNILTDIPDDTVRLIPPTDDISPELKESRFRIQHNSGWCDVPVKCKDGVLPDVIVKRQKGIVPPKIRQDTPRASSIVSAL